jgi:two-component system cell cycle response regulator DivK
VADDDVDNRTIASEALRISGYEVLQASNGWEAVKAAVEQKPDLILMDLSMPKLDGWEAVRRIRGPGPDGRPPIIAFTAHALPGDDAKARSAGCDDYISKPCTPRDIVRKVREWLPRQGAAT